MQDEALAIMDAHAPGSPKWLEARRNGLGASEVAAVLGLDSYKSPGMIWLEKRGEAPPRGPDTVPQFVGRYVENAIAEMYADRHDVTLVRVGSQRSPALPFLWASADRMAVAEPASVIDGRVVSRWLYPVECKNRGGWPDGWGDDDSDDVPEAIAVQAHIQMHAYDLPEVAVAAVLSGNDFRTYRLHRDADIEAAILGQVDAWWTRHIVNGEEPPLTGHGLSDYLKARFKQATQQIVPVAGTDPVAVALRDLFDVRAEIAHLKENEEQLAAVVKHFIGERKGVDCEYGKATWSTAKDSQVVNWEAMATKLASIAGVDLADIMPEYTIVKPGSRRFLPTPRKK